MGSNLRAGVGSQLTLVLKLGVLCSGPRSVWGKAGRLVSSERVSHSLRICHFHCESLPLQLRHRPSLPLQAWNSPPPCDGGTAGA